MCRVSIRSLKEDVKEAILHMSLELKGNLNARYINLGGNNLQMVFKAMVLDESP